MILLMLAYRPATMMNPPICRTTEDAVRIELKGGVGKEEEERTRTIEPQKIVLSFCRHVVHISERGVRWNQKMP